MKRPVYMLILLLAACATAPEHSDSGYPGTAAVARARTTWALGRLSEQVLKLDDDSRRGLGDESDGARELVRARSTELRELVRLELPEAYLDAGGRVDRSLILLYLDEIDHRTRVRPSVESGVGREEFVWRLRHRHMVAATPEMIAAEGHRLLDETDREMARIVTRLYPGKTVAEGLDELKDLGPELAEIPEVAKRAMESARAFVIERDLVTVPAGLREGMIVKLSDRMVKSYPFGAYGGAREVDGRRIGVYLVNAGAAWMTPEEQRETGRGNDPFKTRVIAIHEMWPGHHLQRGMQRRNPNALRRRFYTPVYGEGWALYAEELMYRHGFYRDDRTRLAQLGMRRWRCARMVLDPSLHLGWMTPEEGVEFLVTRVNLERTNARAEVRRYLGNATRPFSYVWGWLEVERLRTDCLAAGMTEKQFHDRFLAAGPIPLPLVRQLLLATENG